MWKSPFERHLFLVFWLFYLLQNVLYGLIVTGSGVALFSGVGVWYFAVNAVYHLIIFMALLQFRKYFRHSDTGVALESVSIPNALTLLRATSLPGLSFLFILTRTEPQLSLPLVIFVALAFLTDLLDGFLSRLLKQVTDLGKILDSTTDYVVLFSLTLVLGITGVLPLWFFILILFRLFWMGGIMVLLTWKRKGVVLETTFWGKASFFALMVLLVLEILVFFRISGMENHWIVRGMEYITGGLLLISILDKGQFFIQWWKKGPS